MVENISRTTTDTQEMGFESTISNVLARVDAALIKYSQHDSHDDIMQRAVRKKISSIVSDFSLSDEEVDEYISLLSKINTLLFTPDLPIDYFPVDIQRNHAAERYAYPPLQFFIKTRGDIKLVNTAYEQLLRWKDCLKAFKKNPVGRFYYSRETGSSIFYEFLEAQKSNLNHSQLLTTLLQMSGAFEITSYLQGKGFPFSQLKREPSVSWYFPDAADTYILNSLRARVHFANELSTAVADTDSFFKLIKEAHELQNNGSTRKYSGTMFWDDKAGRGGAGKLFTRAENEIKETQILPEAWQLRNHIVDVLNSPEYVQFNSHQYAALVYDLNTGDKSASSEEEPDFTNYSESSATVIFGRMRKNIEICLNSENPIVGVDTLAKVLLEFIHAHPFFNVNFSLIMNCVNSILEKKFGRVMSHGFLDYLGFDAPIHIFTKILKYHIWRFSFDSKNPIEESITKMRSRLLHNDQDEKELQLLVDFLSDPNADERLLEVLVGSG